MNDNRRFPDYDGAPQWDIVAVDSAGEPVGKPLGRAVGSKEYADEQADFTRADIACDENGNKPKVIAIAAGTYHEQPEEDELAI